MKDSGIRWKKILFLTIAIALCAMVLMIRESAKPSYDVYIADTEMMSIDREEMEENGYILDKQVFFDLDSEYPMQITTQEIPLRKGRYEITIRYQTDENNCMAYPYSHANRYGDIEADKVVLNPSHTNNTFEIRLNHSVSDFQVRINTDRKNIKIEGITLHSVSSVKMMLCNSVLIMLLFLGMAYLYEKIKNKTLTKQQFIVISSLSGIILLAAFPLGLKGIVESQGFEDLSFHLWRIEGIAEGLKNGSFPVRIYTEYLNGYGYANGIYYGNMFLYIPAFLRLLGYSVTISYKCYILLIHILTASIAYISFRGISKSRFIGLAGSALFTLAPYRLVNVYDRAAVGEYTALSFMPLIFFGLWILCKGKEAEYKKSLIVLVVGCTGVVQSHLLSVILVACGGIAFLVWFWKYMIQVRKIFLLFKAMILTFILNLWFLVPLVDCMITQQTRIMTNKTYAIQKYGQDLSYLTSLITKSDYQVPRGIGLLFVAMPIIWIMLSVMAHYDCWNYCYKKEMIGFMVFGSGCLLLSTNMFPYDFLCKHSNLINTLIGKIQFPWRWLGIAGLFLIILYSLIAASLYENSRKYCYAFILCTLLVATIQSIGMQCLIMNKSTVQNYYSTDGLQQEFLYQVFQGEYMKVNANMKAMENNRQVLDEGNIIWEYERENNQFELLVQNNQKKTAEIVFPLQYYKGYSAVDKDTKEKFEVYENEESKVTVIIPGEYKGRVFVYYSAMWYWKVADIASLIGMVVVVILLYKSEVRKKKLNICENGYKLERG